MSTQLLISLALKLIVGKNSAALVRRVITWLGATLLGSIAVKKGINLETATLADVAQVIVGIYLMLVSRVMSFLRARELDWLATWVGPIIGRSTPQLLGALMAAMSGAAVQVGLKGEADNITLYAFLSAALGWVVSAALSAFEDGKRNDVLTSPPRGLPVLNKVASFVKSKKHKPYKAPEASGFLLPPEPNHAAITQPEPIFVDQIGGKPGDGKPKATAGDVLGWVASSGLSTSDKRTFNNARFKVVAVRGYYLDSMGRPAQNDRGIYDDAMFVFDSDGGFVSFNANTDPTRSWRHGLATLKSDQLVMYTPGQHGYNSSSGPHPAFRQASDVVVSRDGGSGSGKPLGGGYFKDSVAQRFWINLHRGGKNSTSSAGCQTVRPDQWPSFHAHLTRLVTESDETQFPYVLIDDPRV